MELLYRDESYAVIGACFEVYREKGNGFVEPVYQECLELEFGFQKLPFSSQSTLRLSYKGVELKQRYIPDFLCHEKIIVELKAVKELTDEHRAQVLNYLKASGLRLGLLVNFGHYPKLEFERIIL
jgi:GxxExxY protein